MKGEVRIESEGIKINLVGKISLEDIKELNTLLRLHQVNLLSDEDRNTFSELSKDLRKNKDFLAIQNNLKEEYNDYNYVKYAKFNKIIEITQDDKKINTSSKINVNELNKKIGTLFDDLKVHNLDFVLVHTVGDLEKKEHEKMYFAVHDALLEVPSKHIITKKDSKNIMLEVVFFGQDIVDEHYFDLD